MRRREFTAGLLLAAVPRAALAIVAFMLDPVKAGLVTSPARPGGHLERGRFTA
jgi:hypothetical protein